jgi:hypothetical protein
MQDIDIELSSGGPLCHSFYQESYYSSVQHTEAFLDKNIRVCRVVL